jgi:hypothetical protein
MNDSILTLVLFLFIFFIIPSVLKMLGQHSLKAKQEAKRFEIFPKDKDESVIENHTDEHFPEHHVEEKHIHGEPSSKPIEPKMFG